MEVVNLEIWKEVSGFEGLYEVSNLGRVRSLDHTTNITPKNNKAPYERFVKGRILNGTDCNGYHRFSLGRGHLIDAHILVARTFIPNPENKRCVNHIDGNKKNNRVENLEWSTHSENQFHSSKNALMQLGSKHVHSKLKEEDVRWILTHYKKQDLEFGCMALARKYGVSHQTMDEVIKRKTWKHIQI